MVVVGRIAAIVAGVEALIMLVLPHLTLPDRVAALVDPVVLTVLGVPLIYRWVAAPLFSELRGLHSGVQAEGERQSFDADLRAAFEMAYDETAAVNVAQHALELLVPDQPVELLLADASEAHLVRVMSAHQPGPPAPGRPSAGRPGERPSSGAALDGDPPTSGGGGCSVSSPWSCPAIISGRTRVFPDRQALSACPQLRTRPVPVTAAACLPVTSMGRALGVLHVTTEKPALLDADTVNRLRMLAGQAGAGIGLRRAFDRTLVQAETDALTGLLNRRSVEDKARQRLQGCGRYGVLMADLDHFKRLNDIHGHDAGDRAIRLVARVLRSCVREGDLVARYGGEEFLVVLPGADLTTALAIADRMRLTLEASVEGGQEVTTASVGVTCAVEETPLGEAIRQADRALLDAKQAGRNRVHTDPTADTSSVATAL